jgi:outer membrane protein TolC
LRTARPGRLALLATTLCLAGPARAAPAVDAAPAPAPGAALQWREAAATIDQHPLTRQAAARARGAAGAVRAAQELPNPAFGLSVGEGRPRDGGAARREWGASVELPLEALASRGSRVAAARVSEDGAREDAALVRAQVLRELRRTFVALAHAQAVLEAGQALRPRRPSWPRWCGGAERGGAPHRWRVEIELGGSGAGWRGPARPRLQRQRLSGATGLPV